MARLFKKLSKTAGLAPGTLVHVGDARAEDVQITIIDYDEQSLEEKQIKKEMGIFGSTLVKSGTMSKRKLPMLPEELEILKPLCFRQITVGKFL